MNKHIMTSKTRLRNGIEIELNSHEKEDHEIWFQVECSLKDQNFDNEDFWVYEDALDYYIDMIKEFKDYTQRDIDETIIITNQA